jgi:hypothetical protein
MKRFLLSLVLLAAMAAPAPAPAAPAKASSRIRNYRDRIEVTVPHGPAAAVMDSLAAEALRAGFTQVTRDDAKLRMRWEKTATADEVTPIAGWSYEDTERRRFQFEVVRAKKPAGALTIVAVTSLVANPDAIDEKEKDLGKLQPWRDEMKALLDRVVFAFSAR